MRTHIRSYSAIIVLLLTAVMLISLFSVPARAAGPWYVAPTGSDASSCLSPGSPCATINGAIGKASSGDTIYVATGTYTSGSGNEVVLIDKDISRFPAVGIRPSQRKPAFPRLMVVEHGGESPLMTACLLTLNGLPFSMVGLQMVMVEVFITLAV